MKGPLEVFRKLEREVRSPREKLPIDAFLPSLDSLPTDFPDPPPSRLTVQVREMGNASDMEQEKRERRRQRRTRKPAAEPAAPKNIGKRSTSSSTGTSRKEIRRRTTPTSSAASTRPRSLKSDSTGKSSG